MAARARTRIGLAKLGGITSRRPHRPNRRRFTRGLKIMTDEQIRIAVAEVMGWKLSPDRDRFGNQYYVLNEVYVKAGEFPISAKGLPNYPEDLNAMAEARKTLTKDQMEAYHDNLHEVTSRNHDGENDKVATMLMVDATARQRAEAFLRTLNKWKD